MRKMAHAGLLLLAMVASGVFVVDAQDSPPLQVVTKTIEPFVFIDGESFSGFSIDLWAELARRLGLDYEFVVVDTVQEQLEAVESGAADLAIAAISVTSEREASIDFSYPYFDAGLGILVAPGGGISMFAALRAILNARFLEVIGSFLWINEIKSGVKSVVGI